jgi:hypothetical protein
MGRCDLLLFHFSLHIGCAVGLRPGDIIMFNPRLYHSVSSRADPNQDIWITSLYLKAAVVGGNNNSKPLDEAHEQAEAYRIAQLFDIVE